MSLPEDPIAALNAVLSEVLDLVQAVKQTYRKLPETDALHAELERLMDDLRAWGQSLIEQDERLGVPPLSRITSAAGRHASNLWPGAASDDEVRRIIGGDLDRLGQHLAAALDEQEDDASRTTLAGIQRDLASHQRAFA